MARSSKIRGSFGIPRGMKFSEFTVLEESDRLEVCRRWASFESARAIVKWLKEEKDKEISEQSIHSMLRSEKWKTVIQTMREQFTQALIEEPASNKRIRLRRLDRAFEMAEAEKNTRDMIDSMDSAREEMEPRNREIQVQMNQFNLMTDEELLEIKARYAERINRLKELKKEKTREMTYASEPEG